MDAEDRKADELATMRLRVSVLRDTANHYRELAQEDNETYFDIAVNLAIITADYAGLTARRASELGRS